MFYPKHISLLTGIIVFFQLFLLNGKHGAPVSMEERVIVSPVQVAGHRAALVTGAVFRRSPLIRFPDEKRKYCLSENNAGLIATDEEPASNESACPLFIRAVEKSPPASSVSLSLLRAPPQS